MISDVIIWGDCVRRRSNTSSSCSGSRRHDKFGSGIERLTSNRPRSALSLRRELALADLAASEPLPAIAACSSKPRLQRRASTSAITKGTSNSNSFMAETASSGARTAQKGQHKNGKKGRARVALSVRVQGLVTDKVAPQFDRGGFPLA